MTTDENILQEMLDRATNPAKEIVDELGVQMFCMVVRSDSQLIHKAHEMIVAKIRSSNSTESIRAIELLEECMTKCGSEFQDEVGKFRFLNYLIRLVSIKYEGGETPAAIKQRIMECLLLWTTEFPQKLKIREAYDMLTKEGVVEHGKSPAAATKRESVLDNDEEMFVKLLKSGDPENFKRANLLIQYRVGQNARRNELVLQHKSELQEVQNTVGLLNQMLDTYEIESGSKPSDETMNLIRELFMACKKHKPVMQRLPELLDNTSTALIEETLETNDLLLAVMKRYKQTIVHPPTELVRQPKTSSATGNTDLLSQLLSDVTAATNGNSDQLAQPTPAAAGAVVEPAKATPTSNTLAELHDIFGDAANDGSTASAPSGLFVNFDLLEPVTVFPETNATDGKFDVTPAKPSFRELKAIDELSDELFKQSLISSDRVGSFNKEQEKLTLNDLVKDKVNVKPALANAAAAPLKTLRSNCMLDKSINLLPTANPLMDVNSDDLMLSTETEIYNVPESKAPDTEKNEHLPNGASQPTTELPLKHLSDIAIDLDDVVPTADERVLLEDDDVKITLNFTSERPSSHVSVVVISVANKSKLHLKDFQFEASVKKPSKVRLLPPTDVCMPPQKPFRPLTPINQVMLLLNPTGKAVDVTCIVGYKLGDDPDPIKESIVAENIPFVE